MVRRGSWNLPDSGHFFAAALGGCASSAADITVGQQRSSLVAINKPRLN
jgi:hypothetical protein